MIDFVNYKPNDNVVNHIQVHQKRNISYLFLHLFLFLSMLWILNMLYYTNLFCHIISQITLNVRKWNFS